MFEHKSPLRTVSVRSRGISESLFCFAAAASSPVYKQPKLISFTLTFLLNSHSHSEILEIPPKMKYQKLCLPTVAMKHLLAVSVALNVALVLKQMHGGDEGVGWLKAEETLAGAPKRAFQEMSSAASSGGANGVQKNFESGLQEYINLDQ